MKLNNSDNYESIKVFLDKDKHPITFSGKVAELVALGVSEEEVEDFVSKTPFEMEFYYSKDSGLFMVEAEAVEAGTIYNPYSGELLDGFDED